MWGSPCPRVSLAQALEARRWRDNRPGVPQAGNELLYLTDGFLLVRGTAVHQTACPELPDRVGLGVSMSHAGY